MKLIPIAASILLAAGLGLTTPSSAGVIPPVAGSPTEAADSLVVKVRGCHRDVRRHYVPEVGRRMSHFHRGRNCRPLRAAPPRRTFRDPYWGRDCHRDVRRHYLPEYGGSVVHRHTRSCRPVPLRRYRGDVPRSGFCVTIGGFRYCG